MHLPQGAWDLDVIAGACRKKLCELLVKEVSQYPDRGPAPRSLMLWKIKLQLKGNLTSIHISVLQSQHNSNHPIWKRPAPWNGYFLFDKKSIEP